MSTRKTAKQNRKKFTKSVGKIDTPFLIMVLFLLGFGLVMLASASYVSAYYKYGDSYYFIKRQAIWAILGIAVMLGIAFFDYHHLRKFAIPILIVAIILVTLVLIPGIGIVVNGARRWIGIGPLRFQPSEIGKLAIIIVFSAYISSNYKYMNRFSVGILTPIIILAVGAGLVAVETHISGAILIFSVGIILLFVGGCSIKWLGSFFAVGVAGIAGIIFFTDYATSRVKIWLDPFSDAQNAGFQTIQSLYAIGSGGILGLGLGQSRQKHLYIPEPQNDYVFSIVAEELGFIGALIVIMLFIILIWRGFNIAFRANDKFGSLLVIGIISRVAIQTILNIAVVTNAIPVTGISLPFFSYGGTALVILMAEMGIVLSVSRFSYIDKT